MGADDLAYHIVLVLIFLRHRDVLRMYVISLRNVSNMADDRGVLRKYVIASPILTDISDAHGVCRKCAISFMFNLTLLMARASPGST